MGVLGVAGHAHPPVPDTQVVVQRVARLVDVTAHGTAEDVLKRRVFVGHVNLEIAPGAQHLVTHRALPPRSDL